MVHCICLGVTGYNFPKVIVFLSLKIDFVLAANSADPDEMLYYVVFLLVLHCLPKYPFRAFQSTKVEVYFRIYLCFPVGWRKLPRS